MKFIPSTTLEEKKIRFFVSKGFVLVHSLDRGCASDSPVNELLSTCIMSIQYVTVCPVHQTDKMARFSTFNPADLIILMSAGILSPNFTSTMSPSTNWLTGRSRFSPPRRTVVSLQRGNKINDYGSYGPELYPIQYVCTGILPEGLAWRRSSGSWHFWLPIARFLVRFSYMH